MARPDPQTLERIAEEARAIRDEAKHVSRRARLLTQQSAKLESMVDEIVQSQEDTTKNADCN